MEILAIIPVRGGSKSIPRKNIRIMNGKPLVTYAIENARLCHRIMDIVITTDDEEIMSVAKMQGIEYIERSAHLADDVTTLDPVIYDAVIKMEERKKKQYDIVITLQATSPLLTKTTLNSAIESFLNDNIDTYISVVNKPHLSWSKTSEKKIIPNYQKRLNRQQLPPNYLETGAFLITKRDCISYDNRIGQRLSVFEIPEKEAVDIDTPNDWIICEQTLRKKRIIIRADGFKEIGMGHIYRGLTLGYSLIEHEIMFVTNKFALEGVERLKASHMPYTTIEDEKAFFTFIERWQPDIVVNDCLDTTSDYVQHLKKQVERVITIEDLGKGANDADIVINALYKAKEDEKNVFSGEKYICLRDEFLIAQPSSFNNNVRNVLVMFGGTDPCNLTRKIYDLALAVHNQYSTIQFNFILGSGYVNENLDIITQKNKNINVLNNVKRVSDYMKQADLAFTSQGRTVFELASLGVPSIVLAQNEREQLHTFAQMENGFLNLGLGENISSQTIESTFHWLVGTHQVRKEMRTLMLKHDLKKGIQNVKKLIIGEEY